MVLKRLFVSCKCDSFKIYSLQLTISKAFYQKKLVVFLLDCRWQLLCFEQSVVPQLTLIMDTLLNPPYLYYTIMSGLVGYGRYGSGMVGMEAIWKQYILHNECAYPSNVYLYVYWKNAPHFPKKRKHQKHRNSTDLSHRVVGK